MSLIHWLQTIGEILMALGVIALFLNEDKLVAFEDRLFKRAKEKASCVCRPKH